MTRRIAIAALVLAMGILPLDPKPSAADPLGDMLADCTNGAWPASKFPQSEADWETIIRAAKQWRPTHGQSPDLCQRVTVDTFAVFIGARYPDKAEAERHFNDTIHRALGSN